MPIGLALSWDAMNPGDWDDIELSQKAWIALGFLGNSVQMSTYVNMKSRVDTTRIARAFRVEPVK